MQIISCDTEIIFMSSNISLISRTKFQHQVDPEIITHQHIIVDSSVTSYLGENYIEIKNQRLRFRSSITSLTSRMKILHLIELVQHTTTGLFCHVITWKPLTGQIFVVNFKSTITSWNSRKNFVSNLTFQTFRSSSLKPDKIIRLRSSIPV